MNTSVNSEDIAQKNLQLKISFLWGEKISDKIIHSTGLAKCRTGRAGECSPLASSPSTRGKNAQDFIVCTLGLQYDKNISGSFFSRLSRPCPELPSSPVWPVLWTQWTPHTSHMLLSCAKLQVAMTVFSLRTSHNNKNNYFYFYSHYYYSPYSHYFLLFLLFLFLLLSLLLF